MVDNKKRWGVILVNLGTPAAPTKKAIRAFLREFLGDRRVVEVPRPLWWPILYGIILPFRPSRLTLLYKDIWGEDGSPLLAVTKRQVSALRRKLDEQMGPGAPLISYAMTYGSPKLEQSVAELQEQGVERIVVLPLYPQYSGTTTGPVYDQYARLIAGTRNVPDMVLHKYYYDHNDYIEALAVSIETHWREQGRSERLLLSFHGIPQACVDKGDPYYQHCCKTSEFLTQRLGLAPEAWALSFQSRVGRAQWLQPYTDKTLQQWGESGVKSVDVVCPAFSADCLETIEEIGGENRDIFLQAGGESFKFIPCLNDNDAHITMMANITRTYTG